jgi:hypothetical protein
LTKKTFKLAPKTTQDEQSKYMGDFCPVPEVRALKTGRVPAMEIRELSQTFHH